jgi:hypothetical protein
MFKWLRNLFVPAPVIGSRLDAVSWNYFERLERANLPYRTFNEYVGQIVPDSKKEWPAPPQPPRAGTRESRALWAS